MSCERRKNTFYFLSRRFSSLLSSATGSVVVRIRFSSAGVERPRRVCDAISHNTLRDVVKREGGEEGAVNERADGPEGRPGPGGAEWPDGGLYYTSTSILRLK